MMGKEKVSQLEHKVGDFFASNCKRFPVKPGVRKGATMPNNAYLYKINRQ